MIWLSFSIFSPQIRDDPWLSTNNLQHAPAALSTQNTRAPAHLQQTTRALRALSTDNVLFVALLSVVARRACYLVVLL
jgi:hypothetical protein